jgi:hypothetical protein
MNGRLLKKGDADSLQLLFEYSAICRICENLYSKDWLKTQRLLSTGRKFHRNIYPL